MSESAWRDPKGLNEDSRFSGTSSGTFSDQWLFPWQLSERITPFGCLHLYLLRSFPPLPLHRYRSTATAPPLPLRYLPLRYLPRVSHRTPPNKEAKQGREEDLNLLPKSGHPSSTQPFHSFENGAHARAQRRIFSCQGNPAPCSRLPRLLFLL